MLTSEPQIKHKLLVIGDYHYRDSTPSGRRDKYRETILNKLYQIILIANEQNVDSVLFLGDVFDDKDPRRTSHFGVNSINQLLGFLDTSNVFCIVGNHDTPSMQALPRQPISNLDLQIITEPVVLDNCINLMPYGYFREYTADAVSAYYESSRRDFLFNLLAFHGDIHMEGVVPYIEMSFNSIGHLDMDLCVFGHIHTPHLYDPDNIVPIFNPGSVTRLTRGRADAYRHPFVAVLSVMDDCKSFTIQPYLLQAKSPAEIMYMREKHLTDASVASQTMFFDRLLESKHTYTGSLASLVQVIRDMPDVSEPVRRKALGLLGA